MSTHAYQLNPAQEAKVTDLWNRIEADLTDDGKSVIEPILCYLVGIDRSDIATEVVVALTRGDRLPQRRLLDAVRTVANLPAREKTSAVICSTRIMGELTLAGTNEHLSYLGEEDPAVLLVGVDRRPYSPTPWRANADNILDANGVLVAIGEWGGPRKGGRPTMANVAHIVACVNAAAAPFRRTPRAERLDEFGTAPRIARRLIAEARVAVGGLVAWGRLSQDAQLDAVRARAWLAVQAREDGTSPVRTADLFAAMAFVYSCEEL